MRVRDLHVIYNPYHVRTTVRFLENGRWQNTDAASRLSWTYDRRIQRWLEADKYAAWRGFFEEVLDITGEKELDIRFTGTKEDFDDLCAAAARVDGRRAKIRVRPYIDRAERWENSADKLAALRAKIDEGRRSSNWALLPGAARELLMAAMDSSGQETAFLSVEDRDEAGLLGAINRSDRGAVVFVLPGEERCPEAVKLKLRAIAAAIGGLGNAEMYRERYFFLSETRQDTAAVLHGLRMAFLECGLYDANLYVRAQGQSEDGDPLRAGLACYYGRFADQIRLEGLCEEIVGIAYDSGIMDKSYRRSIHVSADGLASDAREGEPRALNYLDRLREQLESWEPERGLQNLRGSIRYELLRRRPKSAGELPGLPPDGAKVGEERVFPYCEELKKYLRGFLKQGCEYAVDEVEKFCGTYTECVESYYRDEPEPRMELPQYLEGGAAEAPMDRFRDAGLQAAFRQRAASGGLTAGEMLRGYTDLALEAFGAWLEEYTGSIVRQLHGLLGDMDALLKDSALPAYREQLRSEDKLLNEADSWLKGFVESIQHLLDIEVEVREND